MLDCRVYILEAYPWIQTEHFKAVACLSELSYISQVAFLKLFLDRSVPKASTTVSCSNPAAACLPLVQ